MVNFKNLTITKKSGGKTRAVFELSPLPEGYGATLGNSLRRVLLSSLQGSAIYQVKIKGATHEFTTIKGVRENVVDLTLNLRQIRLKIEVDNPQVLLLKATKEGVVTAGQIEVPAGVEIVNKDLPIATLEKGGRLELELMAQKGFGFVFAESLPTAKIGMLNIDALYAPVTKVAWSVEKTRLGKISNLDKLLLDITTDGTISPQSALLEASAILRDFFGKVSKDANAPMSEAEPEKIAQPIVVANEGDANLSLPLEEVPAIPSRTVNALKKANIVTVGDVLERDWDELLAVKNMGAKSVDTLKGIFVEEGFLPKE